MWVVFRLVDRRFAIPAEHALEMLDGARVRITPLPATHPANLGVFDARGTLVSVVDLRALLRMPGREEEVRQLRQLLLAREQDHVDWLAELRRCAESGDAFTKATDPTRCAFGKWYEGLRADPRALAALTGNRLAPAIFESWDGLHRSIHALAGEVLGLAAAGQRQEAAEHLASGDKTLRALRASFDEFAELFEAQSRSMILVCQVYGRKFAVAVDELLAVEDFAATGVAPLPPMVGGSRYVVGTWHAAEGPTVQLVDPARILDDVAAAA